MTLRGAFGIARANTYNAAMSDSEYLEIVLEPIRGCADYRPKLGRGAACDLARFQKTYRADSFYAWFGMDDPLVYAAHKTAGGLTSVYRQIGIGGERLVRRIICERLGISEEQSKWSHQPPDGRGRRLWLDARIAPADISNPVARARVRKWLRRAAAELDVKIKPDGAVFEIRQGYKSKDSKRQNADIANAAAALSHALLPCALILSAQMDESLARRYRAAKWLILTGELRGGDLASSYDFMREVVGYDLSAFFARNRRRLRAEVRAVLRALLDPQ